MELRLEDLHHGNGHVEVLRGIELGIAVGVSIGLFSLARAERFLLRWRL